MSRILKRPMFRIGGSANNGIMSMAAPRRNYGDGTDLGDAYARNIDFFQKAAGPGPSVRSDLGDLLISGGLNLLSGKGAGKGTLEALATSYSDPYQTFSKARSAEEANQRQVRLGALTQAITSTDAQRLANMKLKAEQMMSDRKFAQDALILNANRKKSFIEASTILGAKAGGIYEILENLKNNGQSVTELIINTKDDRPILKEVIGIPKDTVFVDSSGKIYKKTDDLTGYVAINIEGKEIIIPKNKEAPKFNWLDIFSGIAPGQSELQFLIKKEGRLGDSLLKPSK